jgi:hypothetical protein
MEEQGATFSLYLSGVTCPYEAYQHMDRYKFERCYKARSQTPAPVKPCPGEKGVNRASEKLAYGVVSMRHQEYKGYKKILQEKILHRSIYKSNVTFIALLRQVVTLGLDIRSK